MSKNNEKTDNMEQLLEQQMQDIADRVEAIVTEKMESVIKALNTEEISREQLGELKKKLEIKQKELDELSSLKAKLENMKQQVGEFYDIFVLYQKFSSETKEELNHLFQKDTAVGIVVSGTQWPNIESLWNYIRIKIINDSGKDTENLLKLFKKVFQLYNEAFRNPVYSLVDPRPGERFDSDRHIIMGIKTDGRIRKVRLAGFVNNRTGKVINKAIVEV